MRLLVVEEDTALGLFLEKGLRLEGYEVFQAGDGAAVLEQVEQYRPDLMLLDLNLHGKDGMEVLAEIAGRCQSTAVMVLTGPSQVEDRVKYLDLGADDCMAKPFSFSELAARCRALLRRRERFADPILRHSGLELNRMEHRVTRNGRAVDLTVKEFRLLEYLMQRSGRCCSRQELMREVWQISAQAETNVVDVYVNYLRKKLAAAVPELEADSSVIMTVRGEGYRIGGKKLPASAGSDAEGLLAGAYVSGQARGE